MQLTDMLGQFDLNNGALKSRSKVLAPQFVGLPNKKIEEWKYCDLKFLDRWGFRRPTDSVLPSTVVKDRLIDGASHLYFSNGRYLESLSMPPQWEGLEFSHGDEFQLPVWADSQEKKDPFFVLSGVAPSSAVSIVVSKPISAPIHLVHYGSGVSDKEASYAAPQVFIEVAPGAECTVVESFLGEGHYFSSPSTQVKLAKNAQVNYVRLQDESEEAAQIGNFSVYQEADSRSHLLSVSMGARFHRLNFSCFLQGKAAETTMNGIYLASGKQFVDHHTTIQHALPHTQSQQLFKGVLQNSSRAVFNGRVHIVEDAQKSNSAQLNKNLVLSDEAEVNTKPEMAIEADDVKAAHGATVGKMDPEEVFYLMSRGIQRKAAMRMLGRGFVEEVIRDFKSAPVRDHILQKVKGSIDFFFEDTPDV